MVGSAYHMLMEMNEQMEIDKTKLKKLNPEVWDPTFEESVDTKIYYADKRKLSWIFRNIKHNPMIVNNI